MKTPSHWMEELDAGKSLDILRDLAWSHAVESGPFAERLCELIHKSRFSSLCDFEIDYALPGLTVEHVRHARQATAFFSKLQHLDIGVDREAVGMSTFLEAEELCRQTNLRMKMRREGLLSFPSRVERVFVQAQRKIAHVLKGVPPYEDLRLRFGPGSTRKTRKADASVRSKCGEGITCSEELFPAAFALLRELPHLSSENAGLSWVDEDGDEWDLVSVEILPSKLCFVFKNAKTYRLIGIECLLNLMLQLGYGDFMARRLAAFGVDIRCQEPNQLAAQLGSLTGALATLDLKSASDTVSRELVYELLPLDWATALRRCSSCWIELPNGSIIKQEKFSAMGNGFTFPLETLIFWALTTSACEGSEDVFVYGDDICCPSEHFDFVSECLLYAGFNVNRKKSFSTGPFRESCGKDFFEGIDVRPFYQKEWISARSLFVLHNWYVRHGDSSRAKQVVSFIHPALRIYGPDGYGDGHLLGDYQRKPHSLNYAGFDGHFFYTYTTRQRKEILKDLDAQRGEFPAALYTVYVRGEDATGFPVKEAEDIHWWQVERPTTFADVLDSYLMSPATPIPVNRATGSKSWPLPGTDGYKKIKIYTLGS